MDLREAKDRMDAVPETANDTKPNGVPFGANRRPNALDDAMKVAELAELWCDPDDKPFATFKEKGVTKNVPLDSEGFRTFITGELYERFHQTISDQQLKQMLRVLTQQARKGAQHAPAIRVTEKHGVVYWDLCDEKGNVAKVSGDGWEVVDTVPVKFVRTKGMDPLPVPGKVSSVAPLLALLDLLNLPDEGARILAIGWLLSALRPTGPYFILQVVGEQGSAKTTLTLALKAIIDPARAGRRSLPATERDLFIAAHNNHCLLFDNVSHISQPMSDALCRVSTGGGFGTRKLFENDSETLFDVTRPVLFNGIEDFIVRQDLIDRIICISVKPIPDEKRMTEAAFWAEFNKRLPAAIGALLNLHSHSLKNLHNVRLSSQPRMADPTVYVTAAADMLGWTQDTFLNTYLENRKQSVISGLEASPLAQLILENVTERMPFEGTPTELYIRIGEWADYRHVSRKYLPQGPSRLTGALTRLGPALRASGIEFERLPRSNQRMLRLSKIKETSATVPSDAPTVVPSAAGTPTVARFDGTDGTVGTSPAVLNVDCADCAQQGQPCWTCAL